MELSEWSLWWKRRGFPEIRRTLLHDWDPIGGVPDDEYDSHVLRIGRMLRQH